VISYPPVTTYLNDPCDLLGNHSGVCSAVRAALARGGGAGARTGEAARTSEAPPTSGEGPGRVAPGARGCGCAGGGAGGGSGTLAALVALAIHLRRRRR
jgi:MYXO-CTERM domain-containing protein